MLTTAFPYALTFLGMLTLWLVGNNNIVGWYVGVASQAAWVAFAVITEQYGFIIAAGFYGGVYMRNLLLWHGIRKLVRREELLAAQTLGGTNK